MTLPAHTSDLCYSNRVDKGLYIFVFEDSFMNVCIKIIYRSFIMKVCTNVVKKHFECDKRLKVNFIS